MFCKACGKNLPDDAKFCYYCGEKTEEEKPAVLRFCMECGAPLSEKSDFCIKCGKPVVRLSEDEDEPVFEKKESVTPEPFASESTAESQAAPESTEESQATPEPTSEPESEPTPTAPERRLCKVCGEELSDDYKFCFHCGAPIE